MPAQDWSRVRKAGRYKGAVDANSIPIAAIVSHFGGEVREGKSASVRCCLHGCVGFKFRRLDDAKPKYGSPTGQKAHLYNVCDITIDSPHIVVCEGELDAIVTSGELGIPAVGVPGVAAWKPHFPKLFAGYETIFVVGDNDIKEDGSNPGAEFAKRVANEVMNSQIVTLPPGMDINDYYLANGIDATRKLLIGESNV
jgi:DNA primase